MAVLEIGNSKSRIYNLSKHQFRLLNYELQWKKSEPVEIRSLQYDGSVKLRQWDGFVRMMTKKGVFPSGLVPRVLRLMGKWGWGHEIEIRDLRERPLEAVPLWVMPEGFELRDYQKQAVDEAERVGRGVIDSCPRSGKTYMMAELVRRVADYTVITAPTRAIASQTYEVLVNLFRKNDWAGAADCSHDFYLLVGGKPSSVKAIRAFNKARVFVSTADCVVGMDQAWWDKIKCLIVDERHHQAAKTYHQINDLAVNAYYRWGFTGTNYRSNVGEQIALEACLGRVVAQFSIREMRDRGVLVGGKVIFIPIQFRGVRCLKFKDAYQRGIVSCDLRNQAATEAAEKLMKAGRRVLILVHEIKHGLALAGSLDGAKFVQGADGEEVRWAVSELDKGNLRCLVGTSVVGEGLDCPSADALIYVKGRKARVTHTQDVFRVLTGMAGKKDAVIIDFADRHNRLLEDHSVERMKNYLEMGIRVEIVEKVVDCDQILLQGV